MCLKYKDFIGEAFMLKKVVSNQDGWTVIGLLTAILLIGFVIALVVALLK